MVTQGDVRSSSSPLMLVLDGALCAFHLPYNAKAPVISWASPPESWPAVPSPSSQVPFSVSVPAVGRSLGQHSASPDRSHATAKMSASAFPGRPSAQSAPPSAPAQLFLASDLDQRRGGQGLAGMREVHLDVLRAAAGRNTSTLAAIQALEADEHDEQGVNSGINVLRDLLLRFQLAHSAQSATGKQGAQARDGAILPLPTTPIGAKNWNLHFNSPAIRASIIRLLLPPPGRVLQPGGGYPHLGALLTTLSPGNHAGSEVFAAWHQPHLAAEMVSSWSAWWRHAALACVPPMALHPAGLLTLLAPQGQPTLLLGVYRRLLLSTAVAGYTHAANSAVESHRLAVVAQCSALQQEMDSVIAGHRATAAATAAHGAQDTGETMASPTHTSEVPRGGVPGYVTRGTSASSSLLSGEGGGGLGVVTSASSVQEHLPSVPIASPNASLEYSPMSTTRRQPPTWGEGGPPRSASHELHSARVALGLMSPMVTARIASDERPMLSNRELSTDFSTFVSASADTARGRTLSAVSTFEGGISTTPSNQQGQTSPSGIVALPVGTGIAHAGVVHTSPLLRQRSPKGGSPPLGQSASSHAQAPKEFAPPFSPERVKAFVSACKQADKQLQSTMDVLTAGLRKQALHIWCQSDSELLLLLTSACEGPLALCRCAIGLYQLYECLAETWGVFSAIHLLTAPRLLSASAPTAMRVSRLSSALDAGRGDGAAWLGVVPYAAISSGQGALKAALHSGQQAVSATAAQVDAEWAHLAGVVAGVAAAVSFADSRRPTPLFTSPKLGKFGGSKRGKMHSAFPSPSRRGGAGPSPMGALSPTATPYARTSTKQLQRLMSAASWSQREDEVHAWRPQVQPSDSLVHRADGDNSDTEHDTDGQVHAHVLSSTQIRLGSTMQLLCRAVEEPMSDREFMLLVPGKHGGSTAMGSSAPQASARSKDLQTVLPLSRLFQLGHKLLQGREKRAATSAAPQASSSKPATPHAAERREQSHATHTTDHSASTPPASSAAESGIGTASLPSRDSQLALAPTQSAAKQLSAVLFSQIAASKAQSLLAWCRLMATVQRPQLCQVRAGDAQLDPAAVNSAGSAMLGSLSFPVPRSKHAQRGASRGSVAGSGPAAAAHRRGSQAAARRGSVVTLAGTKSGHSRRSSVAGSTAWGSRRNMGGGGAGSASSAASLGVSEAVLQAVQQKAQALHVWSAAPGADGVLATWYSLDAAAAPAPYKSFMQALWMCTVYEPANAAAAAAAAKRAAESTASRSQNAPTVPSGGDSAASGGDDDDRSVLRRRASAGDALKGTGVAESKSEPPLIHTASLGSELRDLSQPTKDTPPAGRPGSGPAASTGGSSQVHPTAADIETPGPRWLVLPPVAASARPITALGSVAMSPAQPHRATSAVTIVAQESTHVAWVAWGDLRRAMTQASMQRLRPNASALASQLTAAAEASLMPAALQAGGGDPHSAGPLPWEIEAKRFTVTLTSFFANMEPGTPKHARLPLLRTVSLHSFGSDHARVNPLLHGALQPTVSEWTVWSHEQMKRMARGSGAAMANLIWCAVAESCVPEPSRSGDCWVSPCTTAVQWRSGQRPVVSESRRRTKAPAAPAQMLPLPTFVPLGLQHVLALVTVQNAWADAFGHKQLVAAAESDVGNPHAGTTTGTSFPVAAAGSDLTSTPPAAPVAAAVAPLLAHAANRALRKDTSPQALLTELLATMGPPPARTTSSSASAASSARDHSTASLTAQSERGASFDARSDGNSYTPVGGKLGGGRLPPQHPATAGRLRVSSVLTSVSDLSHSPKADRGGSSTNVLMVDTAASGTRQHIRARAGTDESAGTPHSMATSVASLDMAAQAASTAAQAGAWSLSASAAGYFAPPMTTNKGGQILLATPTDPVDVPLVARALQTHPSLRSVHHITALIALLRTVPQLEALPLAALCVLSCRIGFRTYAGGTVIRAQGAQMAPETLVVLSGRIVARCKLRSSIKSTGAGSGADTTTGLRGGLWAPFAAGDSLRTSSVSSHSHSVEEQAGPVVGLFGPNAVLGAVALTSDTAGPSTPAPEDWALHATAVEFTDALSTQSYKLDQAMASWMSGKSSVRRMLSQVKTLGSAFTGALPGLDADKNTEHPEYGETPTNGMSRSSSHTGLAPAGAGAASPGPSMHSAVGISVSSAHTGAWAEATRTHSGQDLPQLMHTWHQCASHPSLQNWWAVVGGDAWGWLSQGAPSLASRIPVIRTALQAARSAAHSMPYLPSESFRTTQRGLLAALRAAELRSSSGNSTAPKTGGGQKQNAPPVKNSQGGSPGEEDASETLLPCERLQREHHSLPLWDTVQQSESLLGMLRLASEGGGAEALCVGRDTPTRGKQLMVELTVNSMHRMHVGHMKSLDRFLTPQGGLQAWHESNGVQAGQRRRRPSTASPSTAVLSSFTQPTFSDTDTAGGAVHFRPTVPTEGDLHSGTQLQWNAESAAVSTDDAVAATLQARHHYLRIAAGLDGRTGRSQTLPGDVPAPRQLREGRFHHAPLQGETMDNLFARLHHATSPSIAPGAVGTYAGAVYIPPPCTPLLNRHECTWVADGDSAQEVQTAVVSRGDVDCIMAALHAGLLPSDEEISEQLLRAANVYTQQPTAAAGAHDEPHIDGKVASVACRPSAQPHAKGVPSAPHRVAPPAAAAAAATDDHLGELSSASESDSEEEGVYVISRSAAAVPLSVSTGGGSGISPGSTVSPAAAYSPAGSAMSLGLATPKAAAGTAQAVQPSSPADAPAHHTALGALGTAIVATSSHSAAQYAALGPVSAHSALSMQSAALLVPAIQRCEQEVHLVAQLLRQVPALLPLPQRTLLAMARTVEAQRCTDGQVIAAEGSVVPQTHIVLSGAVMAFSRGAPPGQLFGQEAAVEGKAGNEEEGSRTDSGIMAASDGGSTTTGEGGDTPHGATLSFGTAAASASSVTGWLRSWQGCPPLGVSLYGCAVPIHAVSDALLRSAAAHAPGSAGRMYGAGVLGEGASGRAALNDAMSAPHASLEAGMMFPGCAALWRPMPRPGGSASDEHVAAMRHTLQASGTGDEHLPAAAAFMASSALHEAPRRIKAALAWTSGAAQALSMVANARHVSLPRPSAAAMTHMGGGSRSPPGESWKSSTAPSMTSSHFGQPPSTFVGGSLESTQYDAAAPTQAPFQAQYTHAPAQIGVDPLCTRYTRAQMASDLGSHDALEEIHGGVVLTCFAGDWMELAMPLWGGAVGEPWAFRSSETNRLATNLGIASAQEVYHCLEGGAVPWVQGGLTQSEVAEKMSALSLIPCATDQALRQYTLVARGAGTVLLTVPAETLQQHILQPKLLPRLVAAPTGARLVLQKPVELRTPAEVALLADALQHGVGFFRSLPRAAAIALAGALTQKHLPDGSLAVRESDDAADFFITLSGALTVHKTSIPVLAAPAPKKDTAGSTIPPRAPKMWGDDAPTNDTEHLDTVAKWRVRTQDSVYIGRCIAVLAAGEHFGHQALNMPPPPTPSSISKDNHFATGQTLQQELLSGVHAAEVLSLAAARVTLAASGGASSGLAASGGGGRPGTVEHMPGAAAPTAPPSAGNGEGVAVHREEDITSGAAMTTLVASLLLAQRSLRGGVKARQGGAQLEQTAGEGGAGKRNASVVSAAPQGTHVCVLSRAAFREHALQSARAVLQVGEEIISNAGVAKVLATLQMSPALRTDADVDVLCALLCEQLPLFARLSSKRQIALARLCKHGHAEAGAVVLQRGTTANQTIIVLSGLLGVFVPARGSSGSKPAVKSKRRGGGASGMTAAAAAAAAAVEADSSKVTLHPTAEKLAGALLPSELFRAADLTMSPEDLGICVAYTGAGTPIAEHVLETEFTTTASGLANKYSAVAFWDTHLLCVPREAFLAVLRDEQPDLTRVSYLPPFIHMQTTALYDRAMCLVAHAALMPALRNNARQVWELANAPITNAGAVNTLLPTDSSSRHLHPLGSLASTTSPVQVPAIEHRRSSPPPLPSAVTTGSTQYDDSPAILRTASPAEGPVREGLPELHDPPAKQQAQRYTSAARLDMPVDSAMSLGSSKPEAMGSTRQMAVHAGTAVSEASRTQLPSQASVGGPFIMRQANADSPVHLVQLEGIDVPSDGDTPPGPLLGGGAAAGRYARTSHGIISASDSAALRQLQSHPRDDSDEYGTGASRRGTLDLRAGSDVSDASGDGNDSHVRHGQRSQTEDLTSSHAHTGVRGTAPRAGVSSNGADAFRRSSDLDQRRQVQAVDGPGDDSHTIEVHLMPAPRMGTAELGGAQTRGGLDGSASMVRHSTEAEPAAPKPSAREGTSPPGPPPRLNSKRPPLSPIPQRMASTLTSPAADDTSNVNQGKVAGGVQTGGGVQDAIPLKHAPRHHAVEASEIRSVLSPGGGAGSASQAFSFAGEHGAPPHSLERAAAEKATEEGLSSAAAARASVTFSQKPAVVHLSPLGLNQEHDADTPDDSQYGDESPFPEHLEASPSDFSRGTGPTDVWRVGSEGGSARLFGARGSASSALQSPEQGGAFWGEQSVHRDAWHAHLPQFIPKEEQAAVLWWVLDPLSAPGTIAGLAGVLAALADCAVEMSTKRHVGKLQSAVGDATGHVVLKTPQARIVSTGAGAGSEYWRSTTVGARSALTLPSVSSGIQLGQATGESSPLHALWSSLQAYLLGGSAQGKRMRGGAHGMNSKSLLKLLGWNKEHKDPKGGLPVCSIWGGSSVSPALACDVAPSTDGSLVSALTAQRLAANEGATAAVGPRRRLLGAIGDGIKRAAAPNLAPPAVALALWQTTHNAMMRVLVASLPGFRNMQHDALVATATHVRYHRVAAGVPLYMPGDPSARLYIVLDGQVTIRSGPAVVATVQSGGFFGQHEVFLKTERALSAVSAGSSSAGGSARLVSIPWDVYRERWPQYEAHKRTHEFIMSLPGVRGGAISPHMKALLCYLTVPVQVRRGTELVKQARTSPYLFVMQRGTADALLDVPLPYPDTDIDGGLVMRRAYKTHGTDASALQGIGTEQGTRGKSSQWGKGAPQSLTATSAGQRALSGGVVNRHALNAMLRGQRPPSSHVYLDRHLLHKRSQGGNSNFRVGSKLHASSQEEAPSSVLVSREAAVAAMRTRLARKSRGDGNAGVAAEIIIKHSVHSFVAPLAPLPAYSSASVREASMAIVLAASAGGQRATRGVLSSDPHQGTVWGSATVQSGATLGGATAPDPPAGRSEHSSDGEDSSGDDSYEESGVSPTKPKRSTSNSKLETPGAKTIAASTGGLKGLMNRMGGGGSKGGLKSFVKAATMLSGSFSTGNSSASGVPAPPLGVLLSPGRAPSRATDAKRHMSYSASTPLRTGLGVSVSAGNLLSAGTMPVGLSAGGSLAAACGSPALSTRQADVLATRLHRGLSRAGKATGGFIAARGGPIKKKTIPPLATILGGAGQNTLLKKLAAEHDAEREAAERGSAWPAMHSSNAEDLPPSSSGFGSSMSGGISSLLGGLQKAASPGKSPGRLAQLLNAVKDAGTPLKAPGSPASRPGTSSMTRSVAGGGGRSPPGGGADLKDRITDVMVQGDRAMSSQGFREWKAGQGKGVKGGSANSSAVLKRRWWEGGDIRRNFQKQKAAESALHEADAANSKYSKHRGGGQTLADAPPTPGSQAAKVAALVRKAASLDATPRDKLAATIVQGGGMKAVERWRASLKGGDGGSKRPAGSTRILASDSVQAPAHGGGVASEVFASHAVAFGGTTGVLSSQRREQAAAASKVQTRRALPVSGSIARDLHACRAAMQKELNKPSTLLASLGDTVEGNTSAVGAHVGSGQGVHQFIAAEAAAKVRQQLKEGVQSSTGGSFSTVSTSVNPASVVPAAILGGAKAIRAAQAGGWARGSSGDRAAVHSATAHRSATAVAAMSLAGGARRTKHSKGHGGSMGGQNFARGGSQVGSFDTVAAACVVKPAVVSLADNAPINWSADTALTSLPLETVCGLPPQVQSVQVLVGSSHEVKSGDSGSPDTSTAPTPGDDEALAAADAEPRVLVNDETTRVTVAEMGPSSCFGGGELLLAVARRLAALQQRVEEEEGMVTYHVPDEAAGGGHDGSHDEEGGGAQGNGGRAGGRGGHPSSALKLSRNLVEHAVVNPHLPAAFTVRVTSDIATVLVLPKHAAVALLPSKVLRALFDLATAAGDWRLQRAEEVYAAVGDGRSVPRPQQNTPLTAGSTAADIFAQRSAGTGSVLSEIAHLPSAADSRGGYDGFEGGYYSTLHPPSKAHTAYDDAGWGMKYSAEPAWGGHWSDAAPSTVAPLANHHLHLVGTSSSGGGLLRSEQSLAEVYGMYEPFRDRGVGGGLGGSTAPLGSLSRTGLSSGLTAASLAQEGKASQGGSHSAGGSQDTTWHSTHESRSRNLMHLSRVLDGASSQAGGSLASGGGGGVSMARLASAASVLPSMDAHIPHPMAGFVGRKMTSPSQAISRHVLRYSKGLGGGIQEEWADTEHDKQHSQM